MATRYIDIPDRNENIQHHYRMGASVKALADMFGLSGSSINEIVKAIKQQRDAAINKLILEDYPNAFIAEKSGLQVSSVWARRKKLLNQ